MFNLCKDDAKEKSCVHYPICYLLIMKYIYATLIFASDFIFYLILLDLQAVYIQKKSQARSECFDMIF